MRPSQIQKCLAPPTIFSTNFSAIGTKLYVGGAGHLSRQPLMNFKNESL